jgi:phosphopentomutase
VIARPFAGAPGAFERTDGRKDYSVAPPSRSYLQELQAAGVAVHSVGKPDDLFAHIGIDVAHPGSNNAQALEQTTALLGELQSGLIFTNLIDTDQVYGHRKDVEGFAAALAQIDAAIAQWLDVLRDDDLLILTSDHGVDPNAAHTDHTREHAFLLASFAGHDCRQHDGPMSDVGASVLRWLAGRDAPDLPGASFVD